MPTVLAQSNLPKSAAVVVSSETIILRDPNNSILEKYTSDEQKQLSLKSYGIRPATMLSPGENKIKPEDSNLVFFDWLQNVNRAYINTLLKPQADYKYEIDVEYLSGNSVYQFGVRNYPEGATNGNGRFTNVAVHGENNLMDFHLFFSSNRYAYANIQGLTQGRHLLLIENGSVKVDDSESVVIPDFDSSLKIEQPIFLFSENREGTYEFGGISRFYSFKVYNALGRLLLDLKPATKNGIPGFYDSVTRQLFENANNEGSLLVGNIGDSVGFGFGLNTPLGVMPNEEE